MNKTGWLSKLFGSKENNPSFVPEVTAPEIPAGVKRSIPNRLVGAVEIDSASTIAMDAPGGRWAPDPGYKFILVVAELDNHNHDLLFDSAVDCLIADGHGPIRPVGFSLGRMLTHALSTVLWWKSIHFEIGGAHDSYRYAILFAVPAPLQKFVVQLRGIEPADLAWISSIPEDLGTIADGVNLVCKKGMSFSGFIPFGHRVEPPTGLSLCQTPAGALGVIEKGLSCGRAVFLVRAAIGDRASSEQIETEQISATLSDGTSCKPEGVVDRIDFSGANLPKAPMLLSRVRYSAESRTLLGGCSLIPLVDYTGPLCACSELEMKLAVTFRAEMLDRLKSIQVGQQLIPVK